MISISSLPGATLFRSVASIILITIMTVLFLNKTDELSKQAELVAMQATVNEMNSALALVVYQLAVEKKLDRLNIVDKQNPFYYLALSQELPEDYFGSVGNESEVDKTGWFYVQSTRQVVYHARDASNHRYYLEFDFNDRNNSGRFEPEEESVTNLMIKKAAN